MEIFKKCYFCKAKAPDIKKSRGIYRMVCKCGAQIEHPNYDSVVDLWNYTTK